MTRHARGMTLIELLVTIAIVAFVMTSVVGALASNSMQSAHRMVRQQATAIASAYLEEIMQRPVTDPNPAPEAGRADFDNVDDYNGINSALITDQQGLLVPNLDDYRVTVQTAQGNLTGIPAAQVRLINVTVTHLGSGITVFMSGYRTNHPLSP
jgi:MSHA pilin protein MshD